MKRKDNSIFVVQINEEAIELVKFNTSGKKRVLGALERVKIPSSVKDEEICEALKGLFRKFNYNNEKVIVALPRNYATCRYLKVPSQSPEEIREMVKLQASKYLPYPASELITGYEIISHDKDGYSYLNLIIAPQDIINRYLNILGELRVRDFSIILSSFGIAWFYSFVAEKDLDKIMLLDIDSSLVEAEIVVNRKMIFSRYFKFSLSSASWQSLFLDEITKTKNLFIKEVSEEPTNRIMIVGNTKIAQNLIKEIKEPREFSFEIIDLRKKIDIPDSLWKKIEEESCSFFSLIGLALAELPLSLDLLPEREKEAKKASALSRKGLRLSFFIVLAGLFFMLGTVKNLHNKANYLIRLKEELSKIEKEVRPWEEAERRKEIFKSQFSGRVAAIEIIYEINQLMPEGMFLVNLNYEEAREITLRGNTFDLNNVLNFVSRLEKSKVLKDFKIKVRYATKKKTQEGEILDFEINCTRK